MTRATRLVIATVLAASGGLWAAATGRADVQFDFQATSAFVQRTTDPVDSLTLFQFLDTNCGSGCVSYFELRTPQRITLTAGSTGCSQPGGITDRSVYRCTRLPVRVQVTLGPGADAVQTSGSTGGAQCPDPPVTALGFAGADRLAGGCADDVLDGGDGDDQLIAGDGANQLIGAAGNDALQSEGGPDRLDGGTGADTLTSGGGADSLIGGDDADALGGGSGNDELSGGSGKDVLDGGTGGDTLDGGADGDTLDGGADNDVLRGGSGRDILIPGTGSDAVAGGDDVDVVLYEERAAPVTVTLGGDDADGERGEGDDIGADVENVVTGSGSDRLVGSAAANDLDAGAGDDSVDPGGGADAVEGGPGNDTIATLDGVPDRVDCGPGLDTAVVDAFDAVEGCERVTASRALMSDVDNDGIAAPLDCDDGNPLRRPGLPDAPEDGVDADCIAGDARFPQVRSTVSANFGAVGSRARVIRLVASDVPDTATVTITCSGRGCFRGTRSHSYPNGIRRADLTGNVRRLRLSRRSVLEIRILRAQTIGRVFRYTVGKRVRVSSSVLCLRPGATRSGACPRD
jgi:hypothetical protein